MKGINEFRKSINLPIHTSVTEYLNELSRNPEIIAPEFTAETKISIYQFEKVNESYINKTGDEKMYTRTKHVDKFLLVKDISSLFKIQGITYLKHRTYVDNDKASWPLLKAPLPDIPYIHLDFSENIAMKPKFEAQDAHFSGKQYSQSHTNIFFI